LLFVQFWVLLPVIKMELSQWLVQVVDHVYQHGFGEFLYVAGELDCLAGFLFEKARR
jgi:hypothetical protein